MLCKRNSWSDGYGIVHVITHYIMLGRVVWYPWICVIGVEVRSGFFFLPRFSHLTRDSRPVSFSHLTRVSRSVSDFFIDNFPSKVQHESIICSCDFVKLTVNCRPGTSKCLFVYFVVVRGIMVEWF
jgi:hypothetical protein